MLGNLSGWHLVVIVFVVLLLFGAPKLPALARSLGQSMKIFKKEVTEPETTGEADGTKAESVAETVDAAPAKSTAKAGAKKKASSE